MANDNIAQIEIVEVSGTELHHQYPGQSAPQRAYVFLDCRTGRIGAEYNAEIGNAVPTAVYHGHVRRWPIPALRAHVANELLAEISPLASRVVGGYTSEWDGHNHCARFDDDATTAESEIDDLCQAAQDPSGVLQVWSANEWYQATGGHEAIARELGITASTTDAELAAIVEQEEASAAASGDCDELTGCAEFLDGVRATLREAA